ncbi:unnamed protein product [Cuscuta campestris]|uniref:UBZ4-type domain-containing protein n=1 Tax=Cuscuta campestris TaxID=132261 RepID=A0A484MSD9_9ASTE|nr:unnamed protein product [Cuscuta campestris]
MASKTCPVCKNFSSSSNTTLNAHIDRCLSGEPKTVKWASSSNCEASKKRMRPRKTRLMTDIYATAQYCTLEDLDRRNGTTLAVRPSFSAPEMDECGDDNNDKSSPVDIEKTCDEGEVYIDANGTKLRVLSKLNDGKATCSKKFTKGDKGSKFLSTNKKKMKKHPNNSQKQLKIMTSAAQNKNVCSRSPHISEKRGSVQEGSFVRKQITRKEQCPTQHIRSQDNNKMGNEHLSNSYANRSCSSRNLNSPLETARLPKSRKRLEDLECELSDDHNEQLYLKKKASFPMLGRYTVPRKGKKAKLSKAYDHPSAHYSGGITKNDNPTVHSKPSIYTHHHAFSSKAKKFSSLRKLKGAVRSQVPCVPMSRADDKQYDSAEDQIDEHQPTRDAKKARILRTRKEECEKDCGRDIGRDNENNNDNSSTFSFGSVSSSGESDDEPDEMGPTPELYARKKFMDFSKHGASGTDDDSLDLHADHSPLFGDEEHFKRPFICDQDEIFCDVGKTTSADEFQGGYCGHLEVDSIPIPGPPGSFIPSPGRTCSGERLEEEEEDLHQAAYSSLASSRLYQSSSEETSPVSATTTLSNFTRSSDKPASRNPWLYSTTEDNKSTLSNDSIDHRHHHLHTLPMMSCQDPPQLSQPATANTTPPIPVGPTRLEKNSHLYKLSVDTDHHHHHQVLNKVPAGRAESASPSSACKPVIRLMGKDVSVDPTDCDESVSPQANPPPPSQTSFVAKKPYFQARDPQVLFYKPHEDTNNSNQRIWLHSSGYDVPVTSHGGVFRYNNDRRQLESFGVNAATAARGGAPPLMFPPPYSTGRNLLPSSSSSSLSAYYTTSGFSS